MPNKRKYFYGSDRQGRLYEVHFRFKGGKPERPLQVKTGTFAQAVEYVEQKLFAKGSIQYGRPPLSVTVRRVSWSGEE